MTRLAVHRRSSCASRGSARRRRARRASSRRRGAIWCNWPPRSPRRQSGATGGTVGGGGGGGDRHARTPCCMASSASASRRIVSGWRTRVVCHCSSSRCYARRRRTARRQAPQCRSTCTPFAQLFLRLAACARGFAPTACSSAPWPMSYHMCTAHGCGLLSMVFSASPAALPLCRTPPRSRARCSRHSRRRQAPCRAAAACVALRMRWRSAAATRRRAWRRDPRRHRHLWLPANRQPWLAWWRQRATKPCSWYGSAALSALASPPPSPPKRQLLCHRQPTTALLACASCAARRARRSQRTWRARWRPRRGGRSLARPHARSASPPRGDLHRRQRRRPSRRRRSVRRRGVRRRRRRSTGGAAPLQTWLSPRAAALHSPPRRRRSVGQPPRRGVKTALHPHPKRRRLIRSWPMVRGLGGACVSAGMARRRHGQREAEASGARPLWRGDAAARRRRRAAARARRKRRRRGADRHRWRRCVRP